MKMCAVLRSLGGASDDECSAVKYCLIEINMRTIGCKLLLPMTNGLRGRISTSTWSFVGTWPRTSWDRSQLPTLESQHQVVGTYIMEAKIPTNIAPKVLPRSIDISLLKLDAGFPLHTVAWRIYTDMIWGWIRINPSKKWRLGYCRRLRINLGQLTIIDQKQTSEHGEHCD
jgi:hypothetical protein